MTPLRDITVRRIVHATEGEIGALAELLVDAVHGGASVGFMRPLTPARAVRAWRAYAARAASGAHVLLVAEQAGAIIGTVQLVVAQPENQPHRADVTKMLVLASCRRRGVGELLMRNLEDEARARSKTLLVLDTITDSDAARLYTRLGWRRAGDVPDYALMPAGGLRSTTFYYRELT